MPQLSLFLPRLPLGFPRRPFGALPLLFPFFLLKSKRKRKKAEKRASAGLPRFGSAAYFLSHGIGGVPQLISWHLVTTQPVDL